MLINNFVNNFTPQVSRNTSVSSPFSRSKISFCGQINNDTVDFSFSKGLNKLKDYSIQEYDTLTNNELESLRKEYNKYNTRTKSQIIELHEKAAENLKSNLDEIYGENKYTIITIGRSLSSIGKVLGYKIGEDNVINIPMSNANQYSLTDYVEELKDTGAIDKFREFLETKGLTKEKIENSDKKYIIMDYCVSGNSLDGAAELLKREDLLGQSLEKANVRECLDKKLYKTIKSHFFLNNFKDYSFVNKAYYLEDIPNAYIDTQNADIETRLGWFALLDNAMQNIK